MSPLFGHKDDESDERFEQWRRATQAEFERLWALSPVDLATEVMVKGFGPDGPGADDDAIPLEQANFISGPTANDISYHFAPDWDSRSPALTSDDLMLRGRISKLVAEGLQELEHASLVRCQLHTDAGYLDWAATRRGRAALDRGEVQGILLASRG